MTKVYEECLISLKQKSDLTDDRTGTGMFSSFAKTLEFDVSQYAPFLTKKQIPLKSTIGELLWFLSGSTDAKELKDVYKCNFWDDWSDPDTGDIGPMYGRQWRHWDKNMTNIDQLRNVLNSIKTNPYSRRHVVSTWDARYVPLDKHTPIESVKFGRMALAPCHMSYQLYITGDTDNGFKVSLFWLQRSGDMFLGVPVNIASYYILLRIICGWLNTNTTYKYSPDKLSTTIVIPHIYANHVEQVDEYLARDYPDCKPTFDYTDEANVFLDLVTISDKEKRQIQETMFNLIKNYKPHPPIKAPRNV